MILVDTSVWIDHFRKSDSQLSPLLQEDAVLMHPLVIEELACGNLRPRSETLEFLEALPKAPQASRLEFLDFISSQNIHGLGLGAVDVHLLASARLSRTPIWSRDKTLCRAARRLGILAPQ